MSNALTVRHPVSEDLLVVTTFKNLRLFTAMGDRSQKQAAEEAGVSFVDFNALLNLRRSPLKRDGSFTESAERISAWCAIAPEDLFPATLYSMHLPKKLMRAYDSTEVAPLLADKARLALSENELITSIDQQKAASRIKDLLSGLTVRQEQIIKRRFGLEGEGEETLRELGESFALGVERVRQIEATALRCLRYPRRAKKLRPFCECRDPYWPCDGCGEPKACGEYLNGDFYFCASCSIILDSWMKDQKTAETRSLSELGEQAKRIVEAGARRKSALASEKHRQRKAARTRGWRDFVEGFALRETDPDYVEAYLEERRKVKAVQEAQEGQREVGR